jgi:hypothetical protein
MRTLIAAALTTALFLSGCSTRQAQTTDRTKNPPSVPTDPNTGKIDNTVIRNEVPNLKLYTYFEQGLQNKGIYTPDVCFQLVKLTQGGTDIGMYLEMSSVPCPGVGLVEESDVLLRVKVQQSTQYNTQYRLVYEQSYSPEIGAIRRITTNGTVEYRLEGLCDVDAGGYNEGWDTYCDIAVENSLLRNPDPLNLYNLD